MLFATRAAPARPPPRRPARGHPHGRDALRRGTPGRGHAGARRARPHRRHRKATGRGAAPPHPGRRRARRLHGGIRAFQRGGRRADVPGRGAAAHPRRRHRRQADQGQDRRRQLGKPSRHLRIALRQRLHLRPDADRQGRQSRQRTGGARLHRHAGPPVVAQRRAGDPPGRHPGHAHSRPPVRHGPHHQGGAGPRPRRRETRLPLFL